MTLLQIIGGQAWPNFLPILGFRPDKVVFLTSHDKSGNFAASIRALKEAAQLCQISFQEVQISTASSQPTLAECEDVLRSLHSQAIHLVNLTGGTKTMSMAAHRFATSRGIPSFHLDTRRASQPFDNFLSGPWDLPFPDLDEISRSINVKTALKAQGFPVPPSFKTPDSSHLSFALRAAELRRKPDADRSISDQIRNLRTTLTDQKGSFLRKGKLRSALQTPITAEPDSPWHHYLAAAADSSILQPLDPGPDHLLTTLDPLTAPTEEITSQAETNFKLLEGIWFELAVLAHLKAKTSFSDICWSVEADHLQDASASSIGETDLVAFNHKTLNLHFISCKTSGPHSSPLDHIQGLRRRATKEGGQYSKAELWIFRPKSDTHRNDLESHCKAQDVTLRIFTEQG